MANIIASSVILVCGAFLGAWFVNALCIGPTFVTRYHSDPYCEAVSIADRTYKRCWKAVEVTP